MYYRTYLKFIALVSLLLCSVLQGKAQEVAADTIYKPAIIYSGTPKKFDIAGIKVEGIKNYEDYVLIGISGLAVGQTITVPGTEITDAIRRYWRHGLFSNVAISVEKEYKNKIWLLITLAQQPRISEIRYNGVKKSERTDLINKIGLPKGSQITSNMVDRAKLLIKRYFDDKGFKNADVEIVQTDDPKAKGEVIVDVNIDKKEKIRVHKITIEGNTVLKDRKLKRTMKKTNERHKLLNMFRPKKFVNENYEADKKLIIDKYNELGYRDARIVKDSTKMFNDRTIDIYIKLTEGDKYYLRNVTWLGNTVYSTDQLNYMLRMKKGDVYNQKLLNERLTSDDDAIGNLYYNNGYLFYNLEPVEVNVENDSIDLEMRITEGRQASIDKVTISGNDRVYENVIRRELRMRPGDLFSREDLMRSLRELAQMGHFDPEKMTPDIRPDQVNGTVNIALPLTSKANDQVEFSAGWGQTGVIGTLSLKFTNFSLENLLHPGQNYRGILPQGDGQTLTISARTNASYYQQYSISFMDPWFGGKRPNSLSVSAFYSRQTDISSKYYSQSYMNSYYNSIYGNSYNYSDMYDKSKSLQMFGLSVGFGKRLRWPDDYFTLSAELSYQRYILHDWKYFPVTSGNCNNLSLNLTLARNSVDNPIFPRTGSSFSLSCQFTPPYSLFDGVDYSSYNLSNQDDVNKMHRWIEYHKWEFKSKTFTPLMDPTIYKKGLVLMTRADFGLLGYYDKYKKSPFETYDVGGDGMTGYASYATQSVGLRGYENSSLTPYGSEGYAYARLGLELRYPLMLETSTNIYVLGFLEAGNAWHNVTSFNPFDLKRSAGVGVRIFLPMIGLMGIDWGYGFDKVFGSKSYGGSQFHFILGQEF
jgi:outer membrane protein insertion porin family